MMIDMTWEKKLENETCYNCESDNIVLKVIEDTEEFSTIEGNTITFTAPLYIRECQSCKEYVIGSIALNNWAKDISKQIIKTISNPTPNMVKFVRKTFGLSFDVMKWMIEHHDKEKKNG